LVAGACAGVVAPACAKAQDAAPRTAVNVIDERIAVFFKKNLPFAAA
jgi:hypothetical protein